VVLFLAGILTAVPVFGQGQQLQTLRRPAANAPASDVAPSSEADGGSAYHILNGQPKLLRLDHDTEAGSNKPVDVYVFVIELQVMNSDGNFEPVGLQIFNYYTAYAQDPKTVINPHNAHDCKTWANLQARGEIHHNRKKKTWPYVELVTAVHARVLQTNEDGPVFWSDDIECWGSTDRFPPF
jgi:hypothetical protein